MASSSSCMSDWPGAACSSNGDCVASNITRSGVECLCHDGWSGYSDFTSRIDQGLNLDCHTNTDVMNSFVIIALAARSLMLLLGVANFGRGMYVIKKNDGSLWNAIVTYPGRWYIMVMIENIMVIIMAAMRIPDHTKHLVGYSPLGNIGFAIWLEVWSWLVFDVTFGQIRLAVAIIRFDTHRSARVDRVINKLQPIYVASQVLATITQATPLLYFITDWSDTDMTVHHALTIVVSVSWLTTMAAHVCTFLFIVTRILEVLEATDVINTPAKKIGTTLLAAAAPHASPAAVAPAPVPLQTLPPPVKANDDDHATIAVNDAANDDHGNHNEVASMDDGAVPLSQQSCLRQCWRHFWDNWEKEAERARRDRMPRDSRYGEAIHRLRISHRTLGRALVVSIFLIIATAWPYLLIRLNYIWWLSVTMPFQGVLAGFYALVRWPHSPSNHNSSASSPPPAPHHAVVGSPQLHSGSMQHHQHNNNQDQHHDHGDGNGNGNGHAANPAHNGGASTVNSSPIITSARPPPPRVNAFTDAPPSITTSTTTTTTVPSSLPNEPPAVVRSHTAVISVTHNNDHPNEMKDEKAIGT